MMFYSTRAILISYLWIIFFSPIPLLLQVCAFQQPPVKRCPSPRSLCNPNESVAEVFLDIVLDTYFADELGTAVGGDRELVWWALAGGDEGRWWWQAGNGGSKISMRSVQKQGNLHKREEEQEQFEKRNNAVGTTEDEFEEKEEAETMQREAAAELKDEITEWPLDQRGFCCDEGFSCVTLTIDSGWVVCWSEKYVLIPLSYFPRRLYLINLLSWGY